MIRDVMQAASLQGFAEMGILLFVLAFAMILINATFGVRKEELEQMSLIPLDSDEHEARPQTVSELNHE